MFSVLFFLKIIQCDYSKEEAPVDDEEVFLWLAAVVVVQSMSHCFETEMRFEGGEIADRYSKVSAICSLLYVLRVSCHKIAQYAALWETLSELIRSQVNESSQDTKQQQKSRIKLISLSRMLRLEESK